MIVYARSIVVPKQREEIISILKTCACRYRRVKSVGNTFSMYCMRRAMGGRFLLIPITCTMFPEESEMRIKICANAGASIWHGNLLILLGCSLTMWNILATSPKWIPGVGAILLGILVYVLYVFNAVECIDVIQHKLQGQINKTGDGLREPQ